MTTVKSHFAGKEGHFAESVIGFASGSMSGG
jgi:hypothetical protein